METEKPHVSLHVYSLLSVSQGGAQSMLMYIEFSVQSFGKTLSTENIQVRI